MSLSAALPIFFDQLAGRVLVVAAVDAQGGIGSDSNKCGQAKAFCLAAPGGHNAGTDFVRAAGAGGGYQNVTGTSYAAPHVAAALTLMKELFGTQMTDAELAQRLLQTADSSGKYADQDTYGHGLLDIEAATNPVGPTHVLAGDRKMDVDSSAFDFSQVDEMLLEKLKEQKIVVHDSLGGPFQVPLSVFAVGSARLERPFGQNAFPGWEVPATERTRLVQERRVLSGWSDADPGVHAGLVMTPGRVAPPTLMRNPYLGLAQSANVLHIPGGKIRFTGVLTAPDSHDETRQAGVVAHYSHRTRTAGLSVQAGLMLEEHAWLGNRGKGLFSTRGRGQNLFVGIGGGAVLSSGWTSALGLFAGLTSHDSAETGQLFRAGDMASFAFEYTLSRPWAGGVMYARLGQPLRIERGSVRMHLPVRRLPGGGQVFDDFHLDLSPDGRMLDWRLGYLVSDAGKDSFGVEMQLSDNIHRPGTATSRMRLAGSWRMRF